MPNRDNEERCNCIRCKVRDRRELTEQDHEKLLTLLESMHVLTDAIEAKGSEINMLGSLLVKVLEQTGPVEFYVNRGDVSMHRLKTELSETLPDGTRHVKLSVDATQHIKQGGFNVN